MKISELISEARRNPAQNPKIGGHSEAVNLLSNLGDVSRVGITMTHINKVGVNPSTTSADADVDDTPSGVYFYPASYYLEQQYSGEGLPLGNNYQFISIFSYSGNVLNLQEINNRASWGELNKSLESIGFDSGIAYYFKEKLGRSFPSGFANTFWFNTRALAWWLANKGNKNANIDGGVNFSHTWNSVIRKLGYSVVVDPGLEVIHHNEPVQGVVVDPRVIKVIKTIPNRVQETVLNTLKNSP